VSDFVVFPQSCWSQRFLWGDGEDLVQEQFFLMEEAETWLISYAISVCDIHWQVVESKT